jgi:uncharacterized membrane protein
MYVLLKKRKSRASILYLYPTPSPLLFSLFLSLFFFVGVIFLSRTHNKQQQQIFYLRVTFWGSLSILLLAGLACFGEYLRMGLSMLERGAVSA